MKDRLDQGARKKNLPFKVNKVCNKRRIYQKIVVLCICARACECVCVYACVCVVCMELMITTVLCSSRSCDSSVSLSDRAIYCVSNSTANGVEFPDLGAMETRAI